MVGRLCRSAAPLVAFAFLVAAAPPAHAHNDPQYWSSFGLDAKLCRGLKLALSGEFRFGNEMGTLYRVSPDATLIYSFYDWFGVALGYKQVFEREYFDDVAPAVGWNREYRPHLDARFSFKINGFKFSNRNMFELRILTDAAYKVRYRNKLEVVPPLSWTAIKIEPFAAEEIFIDVKGGTFDRSRLSAGFSARPWKSLKIKLYYLWQAKRETNDWLNFDVLATEIKFSF